MSKPGITRLFLGGIVAFVAGILLAIISLVAWVSALLNTVQLADKTWFVLLHVLGLLSFGFIAMIAYVIAGPDGTINPEARRTALPA